MFENEDSVSQSATILNSGWQQTFLHHIARGDEKWVWHINRRRNRQWLSENEQSELHSMKYFLCTWWNMKDVDDYELSEHGRTITAGVYCKKVSSVNKALRRNCSALINRCYSIVWESRCTLCNRKPWKITLWWKVLMKWFIYFYGLPTSRDLNPKQFWYGTSSYSLRVDISLEFYFWNNND